jgi:hypothetical protein
VRSVTWFGRSCCTEGFRCLATKLSRDSSAALVSDQEPGAPRSSVSMRWERPRLHDNRAFTSTTSRDDQPGTRDRTSAGTAHDCARASACCERYRQAERAWAQGAEMAHRRKLSASLQLKIPLDRKTSLGSWCGNGAPQEAVSFTAMKDTIGPN